jgi:thymidine kinase
MAWSLQTEIALELELSLQDLDFKAQQSKLEAIWMSSPSWKLTKVKMARIVDILNIDVFAFGILSDFRTTLFPGSMRLIELADRVNPLQVEALCWCGLRATHNARIINGRMTREGDQLVPGDTSPDAEVVYEVLCRKHHMANMSSKDHDENR